MRVEKAPGTALLVLLLVFGLSAPGLADRQVLLDSPIQVVSRDELAELGLQNAADVLKSPLVVPLDARELSLQLAEEALLNGSTFHGDLDRIRITDIQRIEVLKGPAAATLYGRQASTDVINFTPRLDYSGIRLNGSWTLSEFLPPLNRLWVSTEHGGECDATNGVQRPFWTLFPDHDWAGPAFGDDGNTWFYGRQEEGFTLPGYKYPKLGPFGLPQTDFTDPDSLRRTGFTVLADLVERVENDPSMSEEARSAFMVDWDSSWLLAAPWPCRIWRPRSETLTPTRSSMS